jgi:hypothetical protein
MDTSPAIAAAQRESERATYEAYQVLGFATLVVGGLLTIFVAGLTILLWLDVLGGAWEWRTAWCGLAALLFTLTGVVAKSYGNRADRFVARNTTSSAGSSALVVARQCAACRALSAVDAAVCARCGAAL